MDTIEFIKALENNDLNKMRQIGKTDFHNHAGLGMRFDTFEKWCGVELEKPPTRMNGIAGLDKYIFNVTCDFVTNREGFEFSLKATIEEAIQDGVKILETSIDCCNINYYSDLNDFFNFIIGCKLLYGLKIDFRPEIGVFKGLPNDLWIRYVKVCIESKVFSSIDFYGTESIYNEKLFLDYISLAREYGLKIKYHIGEFCASELMFKIITTLKPDEIQHGIQAYQSIELMDYLRDNNITLHVCPSSNVVLGAVESFETHPISILHRHGINITVNTDDLLLFNSSVSEEYLKLYQMNVLSAKELNTIRIMSLQM